MGIQVMRLGNYSLSVLPPRGGRIPAAFTSLDPSPSRHERRIGDLQRFRGGVYLADGAIPNVSLDDSGRHRVGADYDSWHLLVTAPAGTICGCMRVRLFATTVDVAELQTFDILNRLPEEPRQRHVRGIEALRDRALSSGFLFGEVGGWAVTEELRCGSAGITLAVAVWSLCRLLGGTIAVGAATTRHNSARILSRLGGAPLSDTGPVPDPFFDDYFRCEMRILAFDSRRLSPRYERMAEAITEHLLSSPLVTSAAAGVGLAVAG